MKESDIVYNNFENKIKRKILNIYNSYLLILIVIIVFSIHQYIQNYSISPFKGKRGRRQKRNGEEEKRKLPFHADRRKWRALEERGRLIRERERERERESIEL